MGTAVIPPRSGDMYAFKKTLSIMHAACNRRYTLSDGHWWDSEIPNLVVHCMSQDPSRRPTATSARQKLQRIGPGSTMATTKYYISWVICLSSLWPLISFWLNSPNVPRSLWEMLFSSRFWLIFAVGFGQEALCFILHRRGRLSMAQDSWFWSAVLAFQAYWLHVSVLSHDR